MKTLSHISQSTRYASLVATSILLVASMLYMLIEPQVTHSQQFTIQTTITAETAFSVLPSNVTMVGTLNGITGGQATGTTQFSVRSNNTTGYEVQILFNDNGTANAMLSDINFDESILDYADNAGTPTRGYSPSGSAQFAYTVTSSTTADTALDFFHPAGVGVCGAGGADEQFDTCWKAPTTANYTIVDRNSTATSPATSTIIFNVTVPNGVAPVPLAESYTATATLSLINT